MITYLRIALSAIGIWCLYHPVQAQETKIYTDPYRSYKTGMELFEAGKYSTAQMQFEQTIQMIPDDAAAEIVMYKANSRYYKAICAIELSNPDAEQLMLSFIENYPGHALMGSAYFHLGKIYFKNREYTRALHWFEQVDAYDLNFDDRDTYRFQYAYTLFTKKKLDKAKELFIQLKEKEGPYYFASNYYYGFISYLNDDYNEAIASFNRVKDEGVYALVVPYYFCNIYYSRGEYEKMIAYAEPLIENTRLHYLTEINQLLGQAYLALGNYEKALPYLGYYMEKSRSKKPEDYYQLGFVQYQLHDYAGALDNLADIRDKNDTLYQQAAFLMGNCYIQQDKKEEARNKFLDASLFSIDKNVQQTALFNYAKLSYELQYYPAAVTSLKSYLEEYPNGKFVTDAQELLADALVNTKKYDEALAILNGIPEKSKQLKIAYQKVAYYSGVDDFNNKEYTGAEEMFRKSLIYPIDGKIQAGCYFWLGEINYQNDEYAKAISNHAKYQDVAKASGNPTPEVRQAYSNYTIGYAYFRQSDFANAVKYFNKVTGELKLSKAASQEVDIALDATLRSADCYFMTKEYNKAEKNYAKIIDNNYKGSDYALFQKGMLHGLEGENSKKITTLKKLSSSFPNSLYVDDAMYEIANTHFLMKDNNAAIKGFKALLDEKPNSAYVIKAYLKLGLIYYNMDDLAMAEKYYKAAYELSPTTSEGAEAKNALKDIAEETGDVGGLEGIATVSEKDSISYNAAKFKYNKDDFEGAAKAFSDYLKQYPKGYFRVQALFYRAESYFKTESYKNALADYVILIDEKKPAFLESALVRASWISYYIDENYPDALNYYEMLFENASYKENAFVAMKGLLRVAYQLNNYDDVLINANRILASDLVTNEERIEANYYSGKAYLAKNNNEKAFESFQKTAQLTTNSIGVESRFLMADILYQDGKLDESKALCLEIVNELPAYEEWVIRSYILLADISASKGEYAQAKASLRSIIDNYHGDPQLVELAKIKLQQVEELEKSSRRIDEQNQNGEDNPEELEFNK